MLLKAWVKGFKVIIKQYVRNGEPGVYLITAFVAIITKTQEDERFSAFRAVVIRVLYLFIYIHL
jgi:hypothetical protein